MTIYLHCVNGNRWYKRKIFTTGTEGKFVLV